jgi:hypothetical protein
MISSRRPLLVPSRAKLGPTKIAINLGWSRGTLDDPWTDSFVNSPETKGVRHCGARRDDEDFFTAYMAGFEATKAIRASGSPLLTRSVAPSSGRKIRFMASDVRRLRAAPRDVPTCEMSPRNQAVFAFVYELVGAGWVHAAIRADNQSLEFRPVSYMSDAIGDLATAVLQVREDYEPHEFVWAHEPRYSRWRLQRIGADMAGDELIRVEIARVGEREDYRPPETVFAADIPHIVLVRAVLAVLHNLARDRQECAKAWDLHPFPEEQMRALENMQTEHDGEETPDDGTP